MKKKHLLLTYLLTSGAMALAQHNTPWHYTGVPNTAQAGYIGVGTNTSTTTGNTPLPNYNFHVHGTVDYIESGNASSFNPQDPPGTMIPSQNKSNTNWGTTARIGLTNTMTGRSDMEGTVLQASQLDFHLKNRALGHMFIETERDMDLKTPVLGFQMNYNTRRAWLGAPSISPSSSSDFAKFNIMSIGSDNGMYIETSSATKYGIKVKMAGGSADALVVWEEGYQNPDTKSFKVSGNGEVFARKYTTTLNNIPDYVFADDYDLMTLDELRSYIHKERHLPNIKSAKEMEAAPVDLGEMNRLLLEKVEELTLYVLELEERVDSLENTEK